MKLKMYLLFAVLIAYFKVLGQEITLVMDSVIHTSKQKGSILQIKTVKYVNYPFTTVATPEDELFSFVVYHLEKQNTDSSYSIVAPYFTADYPTSNFYSKTVKRKIYRLDMFVSDAYPNLNGNYRLKLKILFNRKNPTMKSVDTKWYYFKAVP